MTRNRISRLAWFQMCLLPGMLSDALAVNSKTCSKPLLLNSNSSLDLSEPPTGFRIELVDAYPAARPRYYYQQWQLLFDCIDMVWELAHVGYHTPLVGFETRSTAYYPPSSLIYTNVEFEGGRPVSTAGLAIWAFSETAKIVAYDGRSRIPFFIRTYLDRSNGFVGQGCILRPLATDSMSLMSNTMPTPSDPKNGSHAGNRPILDVYFTLTYRQSARMLLQQEVLLIVVRAITFDVQTMLYPHVFNDKVYRFPLTVPNLQIYARKTWPQSPLRHTDIIDALRSMAFQMWANSVFAEADLAITSIIGGRRLHIATLELRSTIIEGGSATS